MLVHIVHHEVSIANHVGQPPIAVPEKVHSRSEQKNCIVNGCVAEKNFPISLRKTNAQARQQQQQQEQQQRAK